MWKNSKNYFQENKTRPYSHTLKPPRFLVCDDLRKIFCKINPIKAKKEIGTMYYVPDESREKAVHLKQNGSLFR